jgi:hypothetical protein
VDTTLANRDTGVFEPPENHFLDYKVSLRASDAACIAEIARDILGFSNADGGILIFGVNNDDREIVGHEKLDAKDLRAKLGLYLGTRVDFDIDECPLHIRARDLRGPFIVVRRSVAAFPTLLRKDIELRGGLVRKMKYLSGSLIYRKGDRTFAEPVYGDIESRARELRFSGAAPRTRSSFICQEDKPGLRLYAHINDRFFGRETELNDLISRFDDPRGKGVSIAGFGGVGKTELAIKLVSELQRRGKFKTIYSGSAKQTLLTSHGTQRIDPAFIDLPSFLRDLTAWLGLNIPQAIGVNELINSCMAELAKYSRILLFVDNLETVEDRYLFEFLDNKLPNNCWLVTTSRVHKIRNCVYSFELREMEPSDAGRLLRHELKRQGLEDFAASLLDLLKANSEKLFYHPLALRWFAWACKKDESLWSNEPFRIDLRDLETFCVAHTLGALSVETQKVLGALIAITGVADATAECVQHTSDVPESLVELALWDLETAGMISVNVDDKTGVLTYIVAPMAVRPAGDLARKSEWELEYTHNLRQFVNRRTESGPETALMRDLLDIEPRSLLEFSKEELTELESRIDRATPRCAERFLLQLRALKAECQRRLGNPVSADELYHKCADEILRGGLNPHDTFKTRVLLEAATVAKTRAQTEPQLRRAVGYLERLENCDVPQQRVLGMLTEFYALLGDRTKYQAYLKKAEKYLQDHTIQYFAPQPGLEEALERARVHIERDVRKRSARTWK